MKIKKLLKRNWNWYKGSGEQKETYIKTLEKMVLEQDKRISDLEKKITSQFESN